MSSGSSPQTNNFNEDQDDSESFRQGVDNAALYSMYPQGVPIEVMEELEKDRMEKRARKNKLCLNFVPGLKGKTNR